MFALISPAKTLDETPWSLEGLTPTQPVFWPEAQPLIATAARLSADELCELMHISSALGLLNWQRFQEFPAELTPANAKPAALLFKGDVYEGLDAPSLTPDQLAYAQEHLGILSGLYGLLRPLDLTFAYRLEMGTRLANPGGKNLYEFWGTRITQAVNARLEASGTPILLNLASEEYFKAVHPKTIAATLITPQFKDAKNGVYKMISFYAKRARGLMARFVLEQRIDQAEGLLDFCAEGYRYSPADSTPLTPVFLRDH